MTIHYYYLDDGERDESIAYAEEVVSATEGLEIEVDHPSEFSKQIKFQDVKFAGLILDLRLDQMVHVVNEKKRKAGYRAPALAQEVRTRAAEKRTGEFPIVLWSFDRRLDAYRRDRTGHDLFDLTVIKEDLTNKSIVQEVGMKLLSLVNGYEAIRQIRDDEKRRRGWFYRLLGFGTAGEASSLDPRILEQFDYPALKRPVHEYAGFIIHHLLDVTGPLIDQSVLAARLGLDIEKSSDAQALFEGAFLQAKYTGPFDDGWSRWWAFRVEEIWNNLGSPAGSLRSLRAEERINHLKDVTGLRGLRAAAPLHPEYSTRYWTVCWKLKKPLDPHDGLLVNDDRSHPWQDERFVSFEAFEQRLVKRQDIDPIDRARLERMKADRS